jgi:predicted PurR-regulated permease PerM
MNKMTSADFFRNRVLAVIAVLLVITALRASYAVTMPVAAAAVIIAAIWPLKPLLDRVLPSKISYVGTILALLVVAVAFIAAVYFSATQVLRAFADHQRQIDEAYSSLMVWLAQWGFHDVGKTEQFGSLLNLGQMLLSNTYTVLAYMGFIAILVILGLPEVPAFRQKLETALEAPERRELMGTIDEITEKVRQYLGVTTLTSLITGVASAVWAFALGLDLALVWGVLNFLLNFVPVFGNIIGIIPPSLYAIIQFQSPSMTALVFIGFAALQIVISNLVYPALQGRTLSLSPVAVVVALAFWSWVWGIAGALIAVPLTVAIVIVCGHFTGSRWVAQLLSR